jgi:FkbM family methyltransferase
MRNLVISIASLAARILPPTVKQALYKLPLVARWVRDGLNRVTPEGLSETTIAGGELAGCRLLLDLHNEKDYWLGTYEPELHAAIRDWIRPGMVAYDIGANVGYISLSLAKRVGTTGKVYAFEALPDNLERLKINVSLNGLDERVTTIPAAVIDHSRRINFLVGPSNGTGKVEGSAGRSGLQRPAGLDDFVFQQGNPAPNIIKIDIEGGEILALPGMEKVLMKYRPIVFLELHGPEAAEVAVAKLKDANYRICRMQPEYPEIKAIVDLSWKEYLLAFPRK